MEAPEIIHSLVDRFDSSRDQYTSPSYNETQIRREFIDPFFNALGWDIDNKQGHAEGYKDVVHEDAIKVGSATKAPDYSFRIGGTRKFFVEAKKPAVNIKEDIAPAFQLRRYAWSAKLPLSILTDFDELAVYDCRVKPIKTDKSSAARIQYLTYKDYIPHWEEIYSVFSRDAVWKGSFDKYAVEKKGKKGTEEVDDAFLKEIESWRDILARNFALRNPKLTVRELNFSVQRTIDRIIFLRICEDRGIETYGALQALVNGERIYKRLCELFHRADEKYNSGLFHFSPEKERPEHPDELTLSLKVDDKVLRDILAELYYPDCPYEFSILPADILGQVYEQFLGKVIRLTAGHQAKVEEKPEVKKAGGVYYTPTYIVDYIVKHTVGKLVEGKTPKQVASLRVLDPACGSGSFLIGAYQYLLDWHQDWYTKDSTDKWSTGKNGTLYAGPGGAWRLTMAERKRIVLNNIYGVDIDSQAVEVTKLSLLLKVLEGESDETINQQLKMFHERALPDLGSNIKCGNSLIAPDFFEGQLIVDPEERSRINAFDWKTEFEGILSAGGFHVVIGNPPYVRVQSLEHDDTDYFKANFEFAWRRIDVSILFMELALRLVSERGLVGVISSNQFLSTEYGRNARRYLLTKCGIARIVDFGDLPVFQNALTYTSIFLLRRQSIQKFFYARVKDLSIDLEAIPEITIAGNALDDGPWSLCSDSGMKLVARLKRDCPPLSTHAKSWYGIITGLDDTLLFEKDSKTTQRFEKNILLPVIRAQDCDRYVTPRPSKTVIYPYKSIGENTVLISEEELARDYPHIYRHLSDHKKELQRRKDSRSTIGERSAWYSLVRFGRLATFKRPKIVTPGEVKHNKFALDLSNAGYSGARVFAITTNKDTLGLKALLGLLNSRLIEFYLHAVAPAKQGGYYSYSTSFLDSIPIAPSSLVSANLAECVDFMLKLHESLVKSKTDQERTVLQRQIDATDKQIDELVYRMYGLTEEEVRIVEGIGKV